MEKKKVLLVDDEPNILKMVKNRLEANHFEVNTAANGIECLQIISVNRPDVIVLDLTMPKMDGYTALREMKANKSTAPIPVVVLTAKEALRDLMEMEGVAGYLVKPFQSDELLAQINKAIGSESAS